MIISLLLFLYTLNDLPKTKLTRLLALNPFAPIFAGWHDALFYGRVCPPETWAAAAAISVAAFAGLTLSRTYGDVAAEAGTGPQPKGSLVRLTLVKAF